MMGTVAGMVSSGLDGIVAADTALSDVDGERGELVIAGYRVDDIAAHATFEEMTWLLWHGRLPEASELEQFRASLAARRDLPRATIDLLRACAAEAVDPMDALRMAIGTLSLDADSQEPDAIVARCPTIVAGYWRLRQGRPLLPSRPDLGHAANFLYLLDGIVPDRERVRALETYLNTVIDHGLNASTFTARVIISTGSDLVSAIGGAIGALKGPLHGGAPGPALDMVLEIIRGASPHAIPDTLTRGGPMPGSVRAAGSLSSLAPDDIVSYAESYLRSKIEAGEKLMGFGHRIYKVRDPRADVLAAAAERMYTRGGDMALYTLARAVEATALRLLEEYKPGKRLQTNVEFYTALLLHGLGLEVALFTPTFAISRLSGWIAHALEQRRANRIIRPQSRYTGPRGRVWRPR